MMMKPPPPPVPPPPGLTSAVISRSVSQEDEDEEDNESAVSGTSRSTTTAATTNTTTATAAQQKDLHAALVGKVQQHHQDMSSSSTTTEYHRGEAIAYLLRYETMVRQQEAEDMAVLAHIRPCVSRLLQLLDMDMMMMPPPLATAAAVLPDDNDRNVTSFLRQEISFAQLKRAVTRLEAQQEQSRVTEFMATDRQLMMVLRLLTLKVSSSSSSSSTDHHDGNECANNKDDDGAVALTWAEFVQCYKICIAGMLTLQHLPVDSAARARARDRTLAMLSLFEPPSTQLFHDDATAAAANATAPALSRNERSVDDNTYAPLTHAASRGDAASSRRGRAEVVEPSPAVRKQQPRPLLWLKKKTKRALLITALLLLLLLLYPLFVYVSVQYSPTASPTPPRKADVVDASLNKKLQRGGAASEPLFFKTQHEPPVTAAATPLKSVASIAKNGGAVTVNKPKKDERRRRRPLLGLWSNVVNGPVVKGVLAKLHKNQKLE